MNKKVNYNNGRKILIVDDVEVHIVMMSAFLSKINPFITIEQASTVAVAIEKLSHGHFDAVVSDWNLPGQSGDVLLKWMRAHTHFNRVPFIMVSGNVDNDDIIHAFMDLGVDAYVTKPFKAQDLYNKVVAAYDKRNPD
jgi:two-component system, sensor histidine kinase and response regulator